MNAFDREIINTLEKPLSGDINELQSYADDTIRSLMRQLVLGSTTQAGGNVSEVRNGFISDSFKVLPHPGMFVAVTPGVGFVDTPGDVPSSISGVSGLDDTCSYKPLVLTTQQAIPIDAAPGVGYRQDIIEVRYSRQVLSPTSRMVLNPTTQQFAPSTVNKLLSWALDGQTGRVVVPASSTAAISYKVGNGSGIPATTPGYIKIADITVPAGATNMNSSNRVADERPLIVPANTLRVSGYLIAQRDGTQPVSLAANIPPGCELWAVGMPTVPAGNPPLCGCVRLYLFAGRPDCVATTINVSTSTNTQGLMIVNAASAGPIRVDSTQQGYLGGSNCCPAARPTALGTGVVAFNLSAAHINADGTQDIASAPFQVVYNFDLEIMPGSWSEISY